MCTPLISTLPLSAVGNGLKPVFVLMVADGAVSAIVVVVSVIAGASTAANAGKLKQAVSNNVAFKIIVLSFKLLIFMRFSGKAFR